jgi:hypothetical protein
LGFNKDPKDSAAENKQLMPVLFVGHGSPMNGIEDNEFLGAGKRVAGEPSIHRGHRRLGQEKSHTPFHTQNKKHKTTKQKHTATHRHEIT